MGKMRDYEASVLKCYSTWSKTYYNEYYGDDAVYPPVHIDLIRSLLKKKKVKDLLDAGCGPASFLRNIFNLKINLYGFDLTPEMVSEARRIFNESGLPPENIWQGSVLNRNAFIPPGRDAKKYDAIICSGVMPHIQEEDENILFNNLKSAGKPGGFIAVEARNQLFALFTLNRYSYYFIRDELIRSNDLLQRIGNGNNQSLIKALEDMKEQFQMELPPFRKGKESEPGYDEVLSRTHNPFILKEKFETLGFKNVCLKFYHYHPLPPMLASSIGDSFLEQSLAIENPDDWRGYFMASAFYIIGDIP